MKEYSPGEFIAGEWLVKERFGGNGRSGMGVVYLVEERTFRAPFVLKTYQSGQEEDITIERFKREAETWVNLGMHPNIVRCIWVKELERVLYVAAEFIRPDEDCRNTLTDFISSGPPESVQIKWFAESCYALRHAYRNGVIAHRDIKPDNLMIDNDGRLKVTDFGLVKIAGPEINMRTSSQEQLVLTMDGSAVGTMPFMAPEQFRDSASVDFRCDIYALGVTFYLLASNGTPPVCPTSPGGPDGIFVTWAKAHFTQEVRRLQSPLMPVLGKCLAKDPNDRYQSIDAILVDLQTICRRTEIGFQLEEQNLEAEFSNQFTLAQSLRGLGKVKEAITCIHGIVERWPNASEAYTELGAAYLQIGNFNDALPALLKSVDVYPFSAAAWNNLGAAYGLRGEVERATNAYKESLRIDPENTGAMLGLAQSRLAINQLREAREICLTAYKLRPSKNSVIKLLAECSIRCGDVAFGEQLLKVYVTKVPNDRDGWFNLSICFHEQRKTTEQIQALEKVVALDSQDGRARDFLADAYLVNKDYEKAALVLSEMSKLPEWEIQAICKWAQLLAHRGNALQGYMLLNKRLEKYPRHAGIWYTMATVLTFLPSYKSEALVAAENALTCLGTHPEQLHPQHHKLLKQMIRDLQ